MKIIKIFLASSYELKADRKKFVHKINRLNKSLADKDLFIHLEIWEELSAQMSPTCSQDEYNKKIKQADLFVLLAYRKVGMYTEEEFNIAHAEFMHRRKPQIICYFKNIRTNIQPSLTAFKKRLKQLGYFPPNYTNFDNLWIQFNEELQLEIQKKLLDDSDYADKGDNTHQKPNKRLGNKVSNPISFMVGRDEQLKQIHTIFNDSENILLLVNGEGGIGKTTIASAYYHQYLNQYKYLIWVVAESGIEEVFVNISLILGLRFADNSSKAQRIEATIGELAELDSPVLLVIDNANDLEDMENNYQLLRKLSNIHLLLTSRITEFHELQVLAIDHLNPTDASTLFKHYYHSYQDSEEPLLNKILLAIDYNTLVIELLSKNLNQLNSDLEKPYPLKQLLDDLQSTGVLGLSQSKVVLTDYSLRAAKPEAIILAMYKLGELTDIQQAILSVFAVLPALSIAYKDLKDYFPDVTDLHKQLLQLAQKSWLNYNQQAQSFKTNPIISEIARQQNKDRLYQDCEPLLTTLIAHLDYETNTGHIYIAHEIAISTVQYAETLMPYLAKANDTIVTLLGNIANFYRTYGNLELALKYFDSSASFIGELYKLHPKDSHLKNNLAFVCSKLGGTYTLLGNLDLAMQNFTDFSTLMQELYESNPNNVSFKNGLAISYEKLGSTHSSLGHLDKALQFYEERSKLGKELYESNPNNVSYKNGLAISYSKLGETHSSLGHLEKALQFYEERSKLGKELYESNPNNVSYK
ncbi:MAG: tetratricopeptide repeat protein, partial [Alcanivoracaceae bacterium]|nr:tetratricopeptide repeat protein [Alcanivoracaceae bacterium]